MCNHVARLWQRWSHEVRFGGRAGVVAYAARYGGGLARWDVVAGAKAGRDPRIAAGS